MTFVYADKVAFLVESQRDGNGQKTELTLDQSYSQEDPTMITDSDVPFSAAANPASTPSLVCQLPTT